jgi:hypothetical protein
MIRSHQRTARKKSTEWFMVTNVGIIMLPTFMDSWKWKILGCRTNLSSFYHPTFFLNHADENVAFFGENLNNLYNIKMNFSLSFLMIFHSFFDTLRIFIFYGFCPSVEDFRSLLELLGILRKKYTKLAFRNPIINLSISSKTFVS